MAVTRFVGLLTLQLETNYLAFASMIEKGLAKKVSILLIIDILRVTIGSLIFGNSCSLVQYKVMQDFHHQR